MSIPSGSSPCGAPFELGSTDSSANVVVPELKWAIEYQEPNVFSLNAEAGLVQVTLVPSQGLPVAGLVQLSLVNSEVVLSGALVQLTLVIKPLSNRAFINLINS